MESFESDVFVKYGTKGRGRVKKRNGMRIKVGAQPSVADIYTHFTGRLMVTV